MDSEGWPEPVYAPPYPFEHYEDNGEDLHEVRFQSNLNNVLPLAIRRHPTTQRMDSPVITQKVTGRRNHSQSTAPSVTFRNTPTDILDPDERPIRPMKDASVYKTNSTQKKSYQPTRKPIATPASQRQQQQQQQQPIIKQSPRYESDSFRATPASLSSRSIISNTSQRRPVRTDLVSQTTFYMPPPPPRSRTRRIIVEDYDDDEYYRPPVSYARPVPEKIVSYKPVSGMTTREWENYQMSRPRRIVRVRSPPVETIIYHT